jgi:hypothetical protein
LLRRREQLGAWAAYAHALKRSLGLILVGLVVYHLDGHYGSWSELRALGLHGFLTTAFQRSPFQTLVHIGVTSIWVLPVILAGVWPRLTFMAASAALHVWLSQRFYYEWVMTRPGIDGGPLGFLTWTIPVIVGSLTYDAMRAGREATVARLAAWSFVLMLLGYAFTALDGALDAPPFVPPNAPVDLWTMSQRAGSLSYLTFSTGFSLLVYVLFVLASDLGPVRLGVFRTLGRNALVGYVLHSMVAAAVKPYVPNDAPLWYVLAGFALYFGITYLFVRHLEKEGIYLKL